ncbi:hypothetical protein KBTX_03774 [wastewater metagenome]|uniref:Integrase catalytic domain-containing protein n=2 Tax=unclassified sequences TaxID=12908 RepID=A0A5B8RIQ9_9ZZZZ|nr:transposase family protein [Arhodomonas sp. KWT]QEA07424.1 hypothetical protein KBTEX_03774 [uncultured organism]
MLKTQGLQSLEQVRAFLEGVRPLGFEAPAREAAYEWIAGELRRLHYPRLGKADKGLVRRYLAKVTGLSRAQITRLIQQFCETGAIRDRRGPPAAPFARRYTPADVRLLAELDALHGTLSGPAARKLCERAYAVFGDTRYERLAGISNGPLYNLRGSQTYQRQRGSVDKTHPVKVNIGELRSPRPEGRPGFLRVDSVHQGDLDGIKGLYHINRVDEVTQFQFVGSLERLSERFLLPVLEALLEAFPFLTLGFYADNGSEYINKRVTTLLEKLRIEQFYRSPAPARATTTPWWSRKMARWCASTSATPTSPLASPRRSTPSPRACSRPTSTSTAPACSPPRRSTPGAASASATATRT